MRKALTIIVVGTIKARTTAATVVRGVIIAAMLRGIVRLMMLGTMSSHAVTVSRMIPSAATTTIATVVAVRRRGGRGG